MKVLVFDTEHEYGIMRPWENGFYLSCLAYCWIEDGIIGEPKVLWYCHREVDPSPMPVYLEQIQALVDQADLLVAHNLKHDLNIIRYFGIDTECKELWCTMLVDYLVNGQDPYLSYGLDDVAERRGYGLKDQTVKMMWDKGMKTYDISLEVLEKYAKRDVEMTALIYNGELLDVLEKKMMPLVKVQNEFTMSLSDMELNGFVFDKQTAEEIYATFRARSDEICRDLLEMFSEPRLNLSSNHQLSAALFGGTCEVKWREWVTKTYKTKPETRYYEKEFKEKVTLPGFFTPPKGAETEREGVFSTDKGTITELRARTPEQKLIKSLLAELSKVDKVCETLRGKKNETGLIAKTHGDFIHAKFNQCVTSTGRLSSSDPNSQNLPRDGTSPIKRCIRPRYDVIVQFDLSQIEWRAAAWLSQDSTMVHEVNTGVDQHTSACVDIMGLKFVDKKDPESKENRNHAKVFNFRMIYGGTAFGFYADSKMPRFSKSKWGAIVTEFFNKYPGLKDWQDANIRAGSESGELVLPTGRRFKFRKYASYGGYEDFNERQFKNYPVQGLAGGDILPLVCVLLRRALRANGLVSKLILTVHDSLVLDCPITEVKRVAKLCYLLMKDLPAHIEYWFQLPMPWNVKLDGECEYGPNYGEMKEITYEEVKGDNG